MVTQPFVDADRRDSPRPGPPVWAAAPVTDGHGRSGGPEPTSGLEIDRPAGWRTYALCRGLGADLFFPVGAFGREAAEHTEGAVAVCRACPVRQPCLEFALATNQEFGIWGGRTEEERRSMRRARRRSAIAAGAPSADPGVALG